MRLKKISLKNIRSYESQTIEFPSGSLLLAGDVGSGKTTLLLAIEYALFGLQPGQKGSALLRNNASSGEVVLECEIDGQEVIIERHLKRETKSVTSDYSALTLDGDTREYSVTELKSRILELLGYPSEFMKKNNLLYRYTVYTPQEQMKQIITEDVETRLNVLRHIFGIDKYKRIRENLTLLLNRLKEESKMLQWEVRSIDADRQNLESINSRIRNINVQISEKSSLLEKNTANRKALEAELQQLDEKIREIQKFEKEVEKTTILITVKNENLSALLREQTSLKRALEEAGRGFNEEDYRACLSEIETTKKYIEQLNTEYLSALSRQSTLNENSEEALKKKERFFSISVCPTCLQDVPAAHKHNILNEAEGKLVELNRELSLISKTISSNKDQMDKSKSSLKQLEKKKLDMEILRSREVYLQKSRDKIEEITKQQETLNKDVSLLSKHLDGLKSEILSFSKYETSHRLKQDELRAALHLEKSTEISIAELKKEADLAHKEIEALQKTISEKENLQKKLASLSSLLDWISGQFLNLVNFTEVQVLMKLRREFSRIFSEWFYMIAGESFEVQLDENFTPIIMQGEVEMDYAFLSGGERTAVALAYRLALNQTINSVLGQINTRDIVILDEPTEGFSEAQIDKIRDVLEELNVDQLIIVSHEQKIESFVDNVLRLRKSGEVSYLDENSPESSAETDSANPS